MLGSAIGRFFRAVVRVLSFGLIKMAEPIERNPEMVGLEFDEVITQKAAAARRVSDAIGRLMAQQEMVSDRVKAAEKDLAGLEQERDGALALVRERGDELRRAGKAETDLLRDPEVLQLQAAHADACSTIEAKRAHIGDLRQQFTEMDKTINEYIIQGQDLAREVERLRAERHEAVASMTVAQHLRQINQDLAGITAGDAGNRLAELRRRVAEAKGEAKAAARIAQTDVASQRQKLREAARAHVARKEVLEALGIRQEEKPLPAQPETPRPDAKLPE